MKLSISPFSESPNTTCLLQPLNAVCLTAICYSHLSFINWECFQLQVPENPTGTGLSKLGFADLEQFGFLLKVAEWLILLQKQSPWSQQEERKGAMSGTFLSSGKQNLSQILLALEPNSNSCTSEFRIAGLKLILIYHLGLVYCPHPNKIRGLLSSKTGRWMWDYN